jgi:hypothetical protein
MGTGIRSLLVLLLFCESLPAGEDAAPVWPRIGARFDEQRSRVTVPPDRLGLGVWEHPPEVISPYELSWYDYTPIVWGGDRRVNDSAAYVSVLRGMFVRGAMNYSQDEPDGRAAAKVSR